MTALSVFPDWMLKLPMQQQSVLVLAARGPDGISKGHPCKAIVQAYRAMVLKAAYRGRLLRPGETGSDFMSLDRFSDAESWQHAVNAFFTTIDALPHHYLMHLMHGAEILGFKHPDVIFQERWSGFYVSCCDDMHVAPETEAEMDRRLGDWNRQHWD